MSRLKSIVIVGALAITGFCVIVRGDTFGKSSSDQQKQNTTQPSAQTAKELKKKKWLRQRRIKHVRDSALKAHMKHQTKVVRKRMKRDAQKTEKYNDKNEQR